MKSKSREIEETLNTILMEIQHLKECMNLVEREIKHLGERVSVVEEFKHQTHVGVYASAEDLKKLEWAIRDIPRGSA